MTSAQSTDATFVFADLAGFTALTEAHGDEQAADLVDEFSVAVGSRLDEHNAEQIKTIGDALMLRALDAADAVRLALAITHDVLADHGYPSVRVGLHHGPAVERGGDWFGSTVNIAARVSALAGGGEVLLTQAVRDRAGDPEGVSFEARGPHTLRNVAEPVKVYAARGREGHDRRPIDPVCRMAVDPERCAGSLSYQGTRYHFCSLECASAFSSTPERYAS